MLSDRADLQPLPVERAAGLHSNSDLSEHAAGGEPDSAALELEKRHLLSSHRGTVSEGKPCAAGINRGIIVADISCH